jgi:hypothetical protein
MLIIDASEADRRARAIMLTEAGRQGLHMRQGMDPCASALRKEAW